MTTLLSAGEAAALCSSPSANVGALDFQSGVKYCDGANWVNLGSTPSFPLLGSGGSAANPTYSFTGDPNTGMYSGSADQLDFSTGGSAKLTLQNNNSWDAYITGNSSGWGSLWVQHSTASQMYITSAVTNTGSNAGFMMYSTRTGNVDSQSGDVLGKIRFAGISTVMSEGAAISAVAEANPNNVGVIPTYLKFVTANTSTLSERMRITSTGNVGIGSLSPGSPLDVGQSVTSQSLGAMNQGGLRVTDTSGFPTATISTAAQIIGEGAVPSGAGGGARLGLIVEANTPTGTTNPVGQMLGARFYTRHNGTSTASALIGTDSYAINNSTNSVTQLKGFLGSGENIAAGTVNNIIGAQGVAKNSAAGSVTLAYGLYSQVLNTNASGKIGTAYGLYLDKTNSGTIGTSYGIYQNDTGMNYFAGNVGIGTTNPNYQLEVAGTISTTSGGIRFPDSTTQTSAAYSRPPVRFTRTSVSSSGGNSNKDAQCASEFGSDYQAAQINDLAANWKTAADGGVNFTAYNDSNRILVSLSSGLMTYSTTTSGNVSVACIYIHSPILFTRATTASGSSNATKDSLCTTEFGSSYQAAQINDLASNWGAESDGGSQFNVYGVSGNRVYINPHSGGGIDFLTATSGTAMVACVQK